MSRLIATTSSPLLAHMNQAGVLEVADVHIGCRLGQLCRETDERVLLAAALCVQALRQGSVAVDLSTVPHQQHELVEGVDAESLPWPETDGWLASVEASPMVTCGESPHGARPLRLVEGHLYLERYWAHQETVRHAFLVRRDAPVPADLERLRASLDELFASADLDDDEPDLQRRAVATSVCTRLSVIGGGPGTGKTSTVARLLAALWDQEPHLRIALCAPTGKAAVRLEESLRVESPSLPERARQRVAESSAGTLHKLLGWVPQTSTRFAHHAQNPLPYDVVIVDEASMVSLMLMARLVEALPSTARLILVGDPDQLTSVEAGAVLGDIVRAELSVLPELEAQLRTVDADGWCRRGLPPRPLLDATGVVRLSHFFRFRGDIKDLAVAIRDGEADAALDILARGGAVSLVQEPLDGSTPAALEPLRRRVVDAGRASVLAARSGDAAAALAALDSHRLLCGHRTGALGVSNWSWRAEHWVLEAVGASAGEEFFVGRPLLMNSNLSDVGLFNGDTGVIVATDASPRAAFERGGRIKLFSPASLSDVTSLWAMTVHKSQGSQFNHVSLILPPSGSPLLTRELLYTAVTRARDGVTIYGSPEAVREAVSRPAMRASGLSERLSRQRARPRATNA